jgi:hypothetical protein
VLCEQRSCRIGALVAGGAMTVPALLNIALGDGDTRVTFTAHRRDAV